MKLMQHAIVLGNDPPASGFVAWHKSCPLFEPDRDFSAS